MISLEIMLRDEPVKLSNMKNSQFRKSILEFCRFSFEKFFDAEQKEKAYAELEKKIMFQAKLFGNLAFIGELYRRKILS